MSDGSQRPINRRQFLSFGLAVAGGVVAMRPHASLAESVKDRKDMAHWAFLSDTHIAADPDNHFRGFYPHQNLKKVTADIATYVPDGIVITGDLSRWNGGPKAYEHLKSMLAPLAEKRPIYMGVGNHDNRHDFINAFENADASGEAVKDKHIITAMAGPVRMIVLDSLLYTNVYGGMIGRPQRTWLETYLQVCDETPTLLFLHHTPRADLLDARRLLEIVAPVKKVKAIVYGHSHKYEFLEAHGIHLINLPAVGYNFTNAQPLGWVEARMTAEAGEFVLHAVAGNPKKDGRSTLLRWRA